MSTVWKRNLAMLWLSQLLVMAGYDALNPFVPLFMRDVLGLADAAQLAKYIAFYNISAFIGYGLSNPVWGWLGDRYGMKPMLLRGTFLTALFWPMMAYVSSPWTLILLRAITAVLAGTTAASQMMIARTAPLERQGFAQGTLTTAIWGGSMLGNVMGGLVIHYWNFTHAFWMCGVLYFVAGISIFFTSDHGGQAVAPKRTAAAKPRRLRLALPRVPAPVWGVIGLFVLMGLVRRVELPYISLRVAQLAEEGEAAYWTGFISAAVGLGAILSGVLFGHLIDKYGTRRLLFTVMGGTAFFMLAQGVGASLVLFGVARTLAYFMAGAIQPMMQKELATATPPEHRGIAFGLSTTAHAVGGSCAALLGAWLMRGFGVQGVFIGAAAVTAAAYPVFRHGLVRGNSAEMHSRD